MLKGDFLYKKNHDVVYLMCLGKVESERVMLEFHDQYGSCPGSTPSTVNQILRAGYYWPTLFKDTHHHVRTIHVCQTAANREKYATLPLQPVFEVKPFTQSGMDFIGLINLPSSVGHMYILTVTEYFTRWTKALACKQCTS